MGFVVIKADDHKIIKIKGNILIMLINGLKYFDLSRYIRVFKAYFGQLNNWVIYTNQIPFANDFTII